MSVRDKFSSDNWQVLPVLISVARSHRNVADLTVAIQDQDFLQSTTVVQQQVGLTATTANPVPIVTQVAQTTTGNSQNDPPLPPCFLGNTLITLADRMTIPIARLFGKGKLPKVMSWANGNLEGTIKEVHRN